MKRRRLSLIVCRLYVVLSSPAKDLPTSMSEHLPDAVVMVSQLMDAVVIAVETRAQYAKHQNLPLLHPGTTRRGSALRCLSSLLRPGPLREGMTRSGTLNTDARNAGVAYMYCKPRRIGGMSSRDFRSNSMAAMSTSPNFIWGSRMVRIKFQILKIYGKTKETSPKIL